MATPLPIPVAQYLRMSTEHQQYSLDNQSLTIQNYAESHGFVVVRTYSDAARSGLDLKHRTGLRQLLQDVVSGTSGYRAILVYDVSRWGRFQDTDESAHYEFLCKSAGVPVHYCAETFANDGSLPSLIMKALKRTMAGEYSRELGVKVLAGQKRLAALGFRPGGPPGYGLRRLLVSSDRRPKQLLSAGERKSIATDRVILIPGPDHEIQAVREVFRLFVSEKMALSRIARELNRRGVPYAGESKWNRCAVANILGHPKYAGCNVFGRTPCKLHTPAVKLPKSEWVLKPGAFVPIVDDATFAAAQQILQHRTTKKSDAEALDLLRALLKSRGRLSLHLIQETPEMPSPSSYRHRFGSLGGAYELVGYRSPTNLGGIEVRRRTTALRDQLISRVIALFPFAVTVLRGKGRRRSRLRLSSGLVVSVRVARAVRVWKETVRWQVEPARRDRNLVTLLARLGQHNDSFLDFHVLPRIDRRIRFWLSLNDPWLSNGKPLTDLSQFCKIVAEIHEMKRLARVPRVTFT